MKLKMPKKPDPEAVADSLLLTIIQVGAGYALYTPQRGYPRPSKEYYIADILMSLSTLTFYIFVILISISRCIIMSTIKNAPKSTSSIMSTAQDVGCTLAIPVFVLQDLICFVWKKLIELKDFLASILRIAVLFELLRAALVKFFLSYLWTKLSILRPDHLVKSIISFPFTTIRSVMCSSQLRSLWAIPNKTVLKLFETDTYCQIRSAVSLPTKAVTGLCKKPFESFLDVAAPSQWGLYQGDMMSKSHVEGDKPKKGFFTRVYRKVMKIFGLKK